MACCSHKNHKTPLAEYAKALRQQEAFELNTLYPMYVVSLRNLLAMTEVKTHQELMQEGILTEMDFSRGKALFVSHQWTSDQHPDPDCKQLKAFQGAMLNILNGSVVVKMSAWSELCAQLVGRPSFALSDLTELTVFVWYDYFSIPQHRVTEQSRSISANSFKDQRLAIASIPSYIHRCELFVVLCPTMKHAALRSTLNYSSWAERGWCRTEAMARELSVKNGSILLIESPQRMTLSSTWQSAFLAPGDGKFTVPDDREILGQILTEMVQKALQDFLRQDNLPGYRFLLNRQQLWLRNCSTAPVPGALADSGSDGIAEDFLLQHGFSKVSEYDKAGWSPVCYAAVGGNPKVMEALLHKRANPNEALRKPCPAAFLIQGQSALAICGRFGNNKAMRILLDAKADPNQPDCNSTCPLSHLSIFGDNVEGARMLLEARADATAVDSLRANAFVFASVWGASEIVKELIKIPGAAPSRKDILPTAILVGRGSLDHMSLLLQIGCDINEQWHFRLGSPTIHFLVRLMAMKHCLSAPTPLNTFAYHHSGATPLMASIFLGNYAISHFLLETKARVDLRNRRNKTAFDLAVKQNPPDDLLWKLWMHGAGDHASQTSIAWWHANTPEEPREEDEVVDDPEDLNNFLVVDADPMISCQF